MVNMEQIAGMIAAYAAKSAAESDDKDGYYRIDRLLRLELLKVQIEEVLASRDLRLAQAESARKDSGQYAEHTAQVRANIAEHHALMLEVKALIERLVKAAETPQPDGGVRNA